MREIVAKYLSKIDKNKTYHFLTDIDYYRNNGKLELISSIALNNFRYASTHIFVEIPYKKTLKDRFTFEDAFLKKIIKKYLHFKWYGEGDESFTILYKSYYKPGNYIRFSPGFLIKRNDNYLYHPAIYDIPIELIDHKICFIIPYKYIHFREYEESKYAQELNDQIKYESQYLKDLKNQKAYLQRENLHLERETMLLEQKKVQLEKKKAVASKKKKKPRPRVKKRYPPPPVQFV